MDLSSQISFKRKAQLFFLAKKYGIEDPTDLEHILDRFNTFDVSDSKLFIEIFERDLNDEARRFLAGHEMFQPFLTRVVALCAKTADVTSNAFKVTLLKFLLGLEVCGIRMTPELLRYVPHTVERTRIGADIITTRSGARDPVDLTSLPILERMDIEDRLPSTPTP